MRGVFADRAGNPAAHSDVITLHRAAPGYAAKMRMFMALLCGFLLLATLAGLAHPDRSPPGVHVDALHAQSMVAGALCGEGSGHGTCLIVVPGGPLPYNLMVETGSPLFQIAPVLASGRNFGPHTPPPRRVS